MGAASGRPSQMGPAAFGSRHLGNSLYAPLVLKALASASIKSIGHRLALKALAAGTYLLKKLPCSIAGGCIWYLIGYVAYEVHLWCEI